MKQKWKFVQIQEGNMEKMIEKEVENNKCQRQTKR